MLQLFGLASGILTSVAYIPYVRDIFLSKTRPQRVTWLIYSVLGGIAFFSQLAKGASNSLWLPAIETLVTSLIFLLSIKYGVGGFSRKDYITIFAAGLGLLGWYFAKDAANALYIVIFVDVVGTWPTLVKSYKDPARETLSTWVLITIGGLLAVLSVGKINFILLLYPFYIFLANAAVAVAIGLGRKRSNSKSLLL